MKIYASRGDVKSLDYYVGKDLWVKISDASAYNEFYYVKVLKTQKITIDADNSYKYYLFKRIPAYFLDDSETHFMSESDKEDLLEWEYSRRDINVTICTPLEVLTGAEVRERLDSMGEWDYSQLYN